MRLKRQASERAVHLLAFSFLALIYLLNLVSVAVEPGPSGAGGITPAYLPLVLLSLALMTLTYLVRGGAREALVGLRVAVFVYTLLFHMNGSVLHLIYCAVPVFFDVFHWCERPRRAALGAALALGFGYALFELVAFGRRRFDFGMPEIASVVICVAAGSVLGLSAARLSVLLHEVGEENRSLKATIDFLTITSAQYLKYASLAGRRARKNERDAITRELHDAVGYSLTNTIALMDHAIIRPPRDADTLRELLRLVRDCAARGLSEVRGIVYRLRSLTERSEGLRDVSNLAKTFQDSTGVEVRLHYGNCPTDLGSRANYVVLRLVQESLVNSFRHGRASVVDVHFWVEEGEVRVSIQDNGEAKVVGAKGVGQKGMEERVRASGGSIGFQKLRHGYRVSARLPLGERGHRHVATTAAAGR